MACLDDMHVHACSGQGQCLAPCNTGRLVAAGQQNGNVWASWTYQLERQGWHYTFPLMEKHVVLPLYKLLSNR